MMHVVETKKTITGHSNEIVESVAPAAFFGAALAAAL